MKVTLLVIILAFVSARTAKLPIIIDEDDFPLIYKNGVIQKYSPNSPDNEDDRIAQKSIVVSKYERTINDDDEEVKEYFKTVVKKSRSRRGDFTFPEASLRAKKEKENLIEDSPDYDMPSIVSRNIIDAPSRPCPSGQRRDSRGRCKTLITG